MLSSILEGGDGTVRRRAAWGGLFLLVLVVDVVTLVFVELPPAVKTAAWASLAAMLAGFLAVRYLDWRREHEHRRAAYASLRARNR
jgi:membrane associated rhomboid family serine protease